MKAITLTTDFGLDDWFVGTMKGVILDVAPKTRTVDITHAIPVGDIRAAAFVLAASYRYFGKGTIHVVVVDPGVGSQRRAIAVRTRRYTFVGPDNGVLSWALRKERILAIHELADTAYFKKPVSNTFHGRDVFAPVAAHLSRGVAISNLGPKRRDLVTLEWSEPTLSGANVIGEVIYVDHFGNAITNLNAASLKRLSRPVVRLGGGMTCPVATHYQAVPAGRPMVLMGSSDLLEISINRGSANRQLKLRVGSKVILGPAKKSC